MDTPTGLLIDGRWQTRDRTLPVLNPYDGNVICRVSIADPDDVDLAVSSAEAGFEQMRRLPAHARADILNRAAALLERERARFTDTIIAESGKPLRYASAEVDRAIQTVRLSAVEAGRLHGETLPMDAAPGSERRRGFFIRVPMGVVGAITPFNFPLNLVCHKVAPALAAGNSVVLKPASATPLTALMLGQVLLDAGLPPRVLNIVVGSGATVGMALVRDSRVRMLTFTGSAPVGETIKAGSGLKKVALELGSNSGVIIDETADLDAALDRCVVGGFAFSGQVCIHTQRLYIEKSVAEPFIERFVARARALKCGDPALAETELGPMIDRVSVEKALGLVSEAVEAGASVLTGGNADGAVFQPTVVADVEPEMAVVCEEVFAPVVTVETFSEFEEVVERFNQGSAAGTYDYGLAAGVFTRDVNRAWRAIETLDVGNVHINDSATFRVDLQPYGGIRDSGIGREGPRFAVEEMTEIRMVSFNLGS